MAFSMTQHSTLLKLFVICQSASGRGWTKQQTSPPALPQIDHLQWWPCLLY